MGSKKIIPEPITRNDVDDALKVFLKKGGKITKIEVQPNPANSMLGDSFDLNDTAGAEEVNYKDLGISTAMV